MVFRFRVVFALRIVLLAGCGGKPDKAVVEKKIRDGLAKSPEWKDVAVEMKADGAVTTAGANRVLIENVGEGGILFRPDARVLASRYLYEGHGSFTSVWDVTTGRKLAVLEDTVALAFSPDGATLVTSGVGGTIVLWDVPTFLRSRPGE